MSGGDENHQAFFSRSFNEPKKFHSLRSEKVLLVSSANSEHEKKNVSIPRRHKLNGMMYGFSILLKFSQPFFSVGACLLSAFLIINPHYKYIFFLSRYRLLAARFSWQTSAKYITVLRFHAKKQEQKYSNYIN
jgi:hypothetical protein